MLKYKFNRAVNSELFYYWLGDFWKNEIANSLSYEDDTFMIREYDYGADDEEEGVNEYHFYHKPSGLKIYWYKYPFRAARSNMDITYDQFREVLVDCKNSLEGYKRYKLYPDGYWWESDK